MELLEQPPADAALTIGDQTTHEVRLAHPVHPGIRQPRSADASASRASARLMPTLFDRLRDENPGCKSEAPSEYAVSVSQMRDIIQRDLGYLLNTTNADDLIDRIRYAEAASSTINFGVRALAAFLSDCADRIESGQWRSDHVHMPGSPDGVEVVVLHTPVK